MLERDAWGFQPLCYLEATSYHGQHPDDPWLGYRLPNGEFKLWLHTWCYVTDARGVLMGAPWSPLPWVFEVPPDGAFISALYGTGYTKKMPGEWRHFQPPSSREQSGWLNGKVYGAVFNSFNPKMVPMYLAELRKQFVTQQDFYACLGNRHAIYSRNTGRKF